VIRDLLGAVITGSAACVLIDEEAAIGKTRLMDSLGDLARQRGVTVLRGAAHPWERTRSRLDDIIIVVARAPRGVRDARGPGASTQIGRSCVSAG